MVQGRFGVEVVNIGAIILTNIMLKYFHDTLVLHFETTILAIPEAPVVDPRQRELRGSQSCSVVSFAAYHPQEVPPRSPNLSFRAPRLWIV